MKATASRWTGCAANSSAAGSAETAARHRSRLAERVKQQHRRQRVQRDIHRVHRQARFRQSSARSRPQAGHQQRAKQQIVAEQRGGEHAAGRAQERVVAHDRRVIEQKTSGDDRKRAERSPSPRRGRSPSAGACGRCSFFTIVVAFGNAVAAPCLWSPIAGCGQDSAAPAVNDLSVPMVYDLAVRFDLTPPSACNPVDPMSDGQACGMTGCPAGTIGVGRRRRPCHCWQKSDPSAPTDCACDRRCATLTSGDAGVVGGACLLANGPGERCGQTGGTGLNAQGCAQTLLCVNADDPGMFRYCAYDCTADGERVRFKAPACSSTGSATKACVLDEESSANGLAPGAACTPEPGLPDRQPLRRHVQAAVRPRRRRLRQRELATRSPTARARWVTFANSGAARLRAGRDPRAATVGTTCRRSHTRTARSATSR